MTNIHRPKRKLKFLVTSIAYNESVILSIRSPVIKNSASHVFNSCHKRTQAIIFWKIMGRANKIIDYIRNRLLVALIIGIHCFIFQVINKCNAPNFIKTICIKCG